MIYKAFGLNPPYKSATIEPHPDLGDDWVQLIVNYNLGGKETITEPNGQAARIAFGKKFQKGVRWSPVKEASADETR